MRTVFAGVLVVLVTIGYAAQLPYGIPREETLIINQLTGRTGLPDDFNFWAGWRWWDRGLQQFIFESLWTVDYVTGQIICALATDLPIYNEDFTQVTIKLREGVYWNDGVPFTADDVVFTIETVKRTPGAAYQGVMAEYVKSVYKVNDYTVVIELTKPNTRFHTNFLDRWGCLWIMPKHVFEKVDDILAFKFNPPVGCGPYKLLDYDKAGYWTLWVKRDDWYRTPTGMLYGEPKPKYILVRAFETEEAMILAMLNNELDVGHFTLDGLRVVLQRSKTTRGWRKEWPWVEYHPTITGISFNVLHSPYDIKDVRWALVLAINIVEYMTTAWDLMAPVSPIHVPPIPVYKEIFQRMEEWLKDFELDLGNGETFKPYDPEVPFKLAEAAKARGYPVPEDPEAIRELFGIGWWKYAPDVAAKLLEKHGFFRDAQGKWYLPDGSPWKIEFICNPAPAHHFFRNAIAAAEQWRNFGIDATATPIEGWSTFWGQGHAGVFAAWPAVEPWGVGVDFMRTFERWLCVYRVPLGQTGFGHSGRWCDPRFDEIIYRMMTISPLIDVEKTQELNIEAFKLLIEEMPTIPTYPYASALAFNEAYWTNFPSADNPYAVPGCEWPNFKYVLPFLKPVR